MIITAGRQEVQAAITQAAQGLPAHPANPVHAGMLISASPSGIALTAGDGDVIFTAQLDVIPEVPGKVILPGRMLADISGYFTGEEVSIDCSGSRAEIISGRSRFSLSLAPGDQYPSWDIPGETGLITVDAQSFAAAVKQVSPAASRTSAVLRTIRLTPGDGKLFLAATNHSALGVTSLGEGVPDYPPALVPVSVMERFARVIPEGDLSLGWDDSLISMSVPGLQVISRQVQGKYLEWQKITAQEPGLSATVNVKEMAKAVRMASLVAGDDRIEFCFAGGGMMTVRAQGSSGSSQEEIPSGYEGDAALFLLGAQLVLEGLAGCPGETVQLKFTEPRKAVYFRDGTYVWMVQPRRELKEETDGKP